MSINKMEMLKGITSDLISIASSIRYYNNDSDNKGTWTVLTDYGYVTKQATEDVESREDYNKSPIKIRNCEKVLTDIEIVNMLLDVAKQLKKDLIKDIESI